MFDVWFNKRNRIIQILLLLIPFVNWVVEVLVRGSSLIRTRSLKSILGILAAIFLPVIWGWVDLVWVLLFKRLALQ